MRNKKRIYALGFFDGVHLGHRALLYACQRLARQAGIDTGAITFEQHPQSLFTDTPPVLLNSTQDRCRLLQRYGAQTILTYPVTPAVMGMPWEDFLMELVRYHGAVGFVCGYDFRFGRNGEGNAAKLRAFCEEYSLECMVLPEQTLDGIRISSTHIRQLIEAGDMETAEKFLGHRHILSGEVVPGRQLGRTIGVPTANILIPHGVVVPKLGVYACKCKIDGAEYAAVTNIGSRPTVGGHQVRTESWIQGFEGDLYDRQIMLEFCCFLREEKKFDSLEELRRQIRKDASEVGKFFKKT